MFTLQQIRDQSPCVKGWTKLLKNLGHPPLDTVISLGDVAASNGTTDAWWCVRALDWSNETLRRQIIGALLPLVKRATAHTTDKRVAYCIAKIEKWLAGEPADLRAAWEAAAAASREAEAAAEAAARSAEAAAEAAAEEAAAAAEAAVWAAEAAAEAAAAAAEAAVWAAEAAARSAAWAAEAAAWAAEKDAQRADLIAAFPPLVLKAKEGAL